MAVHFCPPRAGVRLKRRIVALLPQRLVFFDGLRVRIRDEGTVRNKAVYLALGVAADGTREVLGL